MVTESVLIATLGGQAQVVTFALDDLLAHSENISEVIVLHVASDDPRLQHALAQLENEFAHDVYAGRACRFSHIALHNGSRPLEQIDDESAAEATWQIVHELIARLKIDRRQLHLSVAGGPRMMALMAISAATLHFDHHDRLWHMYTPPEFLERAQDGAILHAQPQDGVHLIQVPLAPWGAYFPALRSLTQATSAQLIAAQTQWLESGEQEHCQKVVRALTERQLDVLRAFAKGVNLQEVAEALAVTVKTVHAHKTTILEECRNAWNLPDGERLTYHFIRDKFERYFQTQTKDSIKTRR